MRITRDGISDCISAASLRSSNVVGAVVVAPRGGGNRQRGVPTSSTWLRSDGMSAVRTGEVAEAGVAVGVATGC